MLYTDSRESYVLVTRRLELNCIIQVRPNKYQIQFKDAFCPLIRNASGNETQHFIPLAPSCNTKVPRMVITDHKLTQVPFVAGVT